MPSVVAWVGFAMVVVVSSVGAEENEIDWAKEKEFWSFRPPVLPEVPAVKREDWVINDVDRFILQRIERRGLAPAPAANRAKLFRRVSLDLIGLPPAGEGTDIIALVERRGSYLELVDSLMESPRYGERWASLWMNVVRYAEDQPGGNPSNFHGAHHYRQWVMDAFNRDLPYDEFVRKQLAADLYGEGDEVALGFLALGPYPPGRSNVQQRADAWADRVDMVTRGLLGLSVACARCHDHLYDPISSEDYYGLAGIFASTDLEYDLTPNRGAHLVTDAVLRNLRVFYDGDPETPGPLVPRRNIRVLSPRPDLKAYQNGSGRRVLADELTSRENPLLARVIVNRIWGELFGQPLVATPSDFGHHGERPTHPELLDYLAVRLMENSWSLKWLLRELVTSATYRQRTLRAGSPGLADYAGMPRRRLTAEMIRDSMLVASGELTHEGRGSARLDDPMNLRRTVFGVVSRSSLNEFLREFDYPDPAGHSPQRQTTITATQKLYLLNSAFVQARAGKLAQELGELRTGSGLNALYIRLLGRHPTSSERKIAAELLGGSTVPDHRTWTKLAQVLLSSNAFLYRD